MPTNSKTTADPILDVPTWAKRVVILAVDPGTTGAIALFDTGEYYRGVQHRPVLGEPNVERPDERIEEIASDPYCYAIVIVEKKRGRQSMFIASQLSASRWAAYIKARFGSKTNPANPKKRHCLVLVDPSTWQASLRVHHPEKPPTRALSVPRIPYTDYAVDRFSLKSAPNVDECAALCLLAWASDQILFPLAYLDRRTTIPGWDELLAVMGRGIPASTE